MDLQGRLLGSEWTSSHPALVFYYIYRSLASTDRNNTRMMVYHQCTFFRNGSSNIIGYLTHLKVRLSYTPRGFEAGPATVLAAQRPPSACERLPAALSRARDPRLPCQRSGSVGAPGAVRVAVGVALCRASPLATASGGGSPSSRTKGEWRARRPRRTDPSPSGMAQGEPVGSTGAARLVSVDGDEYVLAREKFCFFGGDSSPQAAS